MNEIKKTDTGWREELSPEVYEVTRRKGTERPFSGRFYLHKETGSYRCVCCGSELFSSETKFDSGCGWPSFYAPIEGNVRYQTDTSDGTQRTEVLCACCDAHLGHVFDEGSCPTGQRYCINSVCLEFEPERD